VVGQRSAASSTLQRREWSRFFFLEHAIGKRVMLIMLLLLTMMASHGSGTLR
jgi:hypothetical protein